MLERLRCCVIGIKVLFAHVDNCNTSRHLMQHKYTWTNQKTNCPRVTITKMKSNYLFEVQLQFSYFD